jgi:hypothetical protein
LNKVLKRRRPVVLAAVAVAAVLGLAGCSFTGGGQLPGQNAPYATIAFSAVNTGVTNGNANVSNSNVTGNYQDGYVKFRFSGGGQAGGDPCTYVDFSYTSTNRAYPGSGSGYMIVCDYGQPNHGNDTVEIHITSGPYDGYGNSGQVTIGNLKVNQQAP